MRCCHKEKNARCPGQCASKLLFEASSFVSPPDLAPCADAQVAGFHRAVPSTTLDNGYMMVKRRKAFHHIFIARCSIVGLIIAGFPRLSRKNAKKQRRSRNLPQQGGKFLRLGAGELLCLLAALLYAGAILLTARLSREDEPLTLGILQIGFIGLFGWIVAALFETPTLPRDGVTWGAIGYLALVCSCFGFTLQPMAQRYVSAERAGLFCALNPLTAALLGALFLGERLGLAGLLGAGLILLGILVQRGKGRSRVRRQEIAVRPWAHSHRDTAA